MAEGIDLNLRLKDTEDSERPSQLHKAAARGDVEGCERLLEGGEGVDQADQLGWTPLMVAASAGHEQLVTAVLLPGGADVKLRNAHGVSVLPLAVARCGCGLLRELYRRLGPELCQTESDLALHAACLRGRLDVVSWLLSDTTAHINCVSPITGWTALMVAVEGQHVSLVELLLERGADTTITSCLGEDVYDLAAATGCPQLLHALQDHCVASLSNPEFAFHLIDSPNCVRTEEIGDDGVFKNSPTCPVFRTCNDDYDHCSSPGRNPGLSPSRRGVFRPSPTRKLSPLYSEYSLHSLVSPRRVPSPTESPSRGRKRKLSNKFSCSSWLKGLTKRRARSLEDTDNDDVKIAKQAGIDFSHLLFGLGIEEFAPIFKEQELDIWTFLTLKEEDLEIMGIHEEMSKKRILKGIQMLRKSQL